MNQILNEPRVDVKFVKTIYRTSLTVATDRIRK